MHRRELLRAAAAAAALTLLPRDARAAWAKAATGSTQQLLTPAQQRLVSAMADAIIPRTNTVGALDVGVTAWIDVIVADYYNDADRAALRTGLDAIDALAVSMGGAPFAALSSADRTRVMEALDKPSDRNAPAVRGYSRLKGLVVHGYFTSERVQRDVLKTNVMPGKFDGGAPHPMVTEGGRAR